jgi:hypothetical protein
LGHFSSEHCKEETREREKEKKWEKIVYDSGGLRTLLCELKSRESFFFFFFFLEFLVFIFPV